MERLRRVFVVVAIAGAAACGGGSQGSGETGPKAGSLPKPDMFAATEATLAGHRCSGQVCTCRAQGEAEETTPPAEGTKRFEVRLTVTGGKGWLTFAGSKFAKLADTPEECWYLDLAPGEHPLSLVVKASDDKAGAGVSLRVREYRVEGAAWYDAFDWQCGDPESCSLEALDELKAALSKDKRLLRDPCSSVRPRAVAWENGRVPDAMHPEDVRLTATLAVGKWTPKEPPETAGCLDN